MNLSKRAAAAAVAIAVTLLGLVACSDTSEPTPTASATPSPTPTATETTVTTSPQPTASPTPTGTTTLTGRVVSIKFAEDSSGRCDEVYATDVVLEITDSSGIKGVQFHDPIGEIGQPDSLGNTVRITVVPDDYQEITLVSGEESFPVTGDCIEGSIPSSVYGRFLVGVPYNAATWETLERE